MVLLLSSISKLDISLEKNLVDAPIFWPFIVSAWYASRHPFYSQLLNDLKCHAAFHHCATAEKRTASIYQKKIFSFKSLSYCRRARQIDDFCGGCKSTIKNRAVFLRSTENSLFGQELFSLMSSVTHTLVKNSTSGFPLVTFRSQNTSQRLLPTMSDSFWTLISGSSEGSLRKAVKGQGNGSRGRSRGC